MLHSLLKDCLLYLTIFMGLVTAGFAQVRADFALQEILIIDAQNDYLISLKDFTDNRIQDEVITPGKGVSVQANVGGTVIGGFLNDTNAIVFNGNLHDNSNHVTAAFHDKRRVFAASYLQIDTGAFYTIVSTEPFSKSLRFLRLKNNKRVEASLDLARFFPPPASGLFLEGWGIVHFTPLSLN